MLFALIIACILILPVLFSLKCDGTVGDNVPWVALWSPMWLWDLFTIATSLALFTIPSSSGKTAEEKAQMKKDRKEARAAAGGATEDDHDDDDDDIDESDVTFLAKIINLVVALLLILIQIFVLMRLDKSITWNWFAVFSPWFIYEFLTVLNVLPSAFLEELIPPPEIPPPTTIESEHDFDDYIMKKITAENEFFQKQFLQSKNRKAVVVCFLRAWQAIFLALQVNHDVHWNWGLVFLPIWLYLFIQYVDYYILNAWSARKINGIDLEAIAQSGVVDPITESKLQQSQILKSASSSICFFQIFALLSSILLVCRLQTSHYSTFFIIIPVFLAIWVCCCFSFTALICLGCVDTNELSNQTAQDYANANNEASETTSGQDLEAPILSGYESNTPNYTNNQPVVISTKPPAQDNEFFPPPLPEENEASLPTPPPPQEKIASALPPTSINEDID